MTEDKIRIGPEAQKQMDALRRGAVEIIPEEELGLKIQKSLDSGKPLRVKYGADPSAPDLHVGHVVPIRKLRQFQDLGHHVVFIIGDFTAMIGDPSGKSETRKRLSPEQVQENAKTYFDQVFMLLDPDKTEVVRNNDWLGKLSMTDVIELAAKYTVARMLERDDFDKRFKSEKAIYVHEFLYPLAQAYDSVAVRADVEVGGTDQKFNLLLGREIQREMGQEPQAVLTMPLLPGTDGVKKMSKSLGNYIGITECPRDIFGKTMSIPDEMMGDYLQLVLGYGEEAARQTLDELETGGLHPRNLKVQIASELVAAFHSTEAAKAEKEHFDRVFRDGDLPEDMPEKEVAVPDGEGDIWIAPVLVEAGLYPSNSKARKGIREGAVKMDGEKVTSEDARLARGEMVLQAGKRQFCRVRLT